MTSRKAERAVERDTEKQEEEKERGGGGGGRRAEKRRRRGERRERERGKNMALASCMCKIRKGIAVNSFV